jgi:hypothetical protein
MKKISWSPWKDVHFQRKFLDNIAIKNNFTTHDDWYSATRGFIAKQGGSSLLALYGNSVSKGNELLYRSKICLLCHKIIIEVFAILFVFRSKSYFVLTRHRL